MNKEELQKEFESLYAAVEKWRGAFPGTTERKVLSFLDHYREQMKEEDHENYLNAQRFSVYFDLATKARIEKPLNLQEITDRIGKPVFLIDKSNKREWKVLEKLVMDKDGVWLHFTDEDRLFHWWRDPLDFVFDHEPPEEAGGKETDKG